MIYDTCTIITNHVEETGIAVGFLLGMGFAFLVIFTLSIFVDVDK